MALAGLLALLAPPRCAACGIEVSGGEAICRSCRLQLPWLAKGACRRCALPAHTRRCPAARAPWVEAWAPMVYDGAARALVIALKSRGDRDAAAVMAAQMVAAIPARLPSGAGLVPVPAHPSRRRQRGHDHAALLARVTSRRIRLPFAPCLRRAAGARAQTGAGRAARRAAGGDGVALAAPAPAIALLIDDVHTTGTTLAACALALRQGGCEAVYCLTYARTL